MGRGTGHRSSVRADANRQVVSVMAEMPQFHLDVVQAAPPAIGELRPGCLGSGQPVPGLVGHQDELAVVAGLFVVAGRLDEQLPYPCRSDAATTAHGPGFRDKQTGLDSGMVGPASAPYRHSKRVRITLRNSVITVIQTAT